MKKLLILFLFSLILFVPACSDDDDTGDVKSIEIEGLAGDTLRLMRYDNYQINLRIDPPKGTVKYVSNNQNVFKVNEDGLITAVDGGVGQLIVIGANGDSWTKALCIIEVTALVDSIYTNLDYKYNFVSEGSTLNVSSFFVGYPATAANRTLRYETEDKSIATVDENGVVTPVNKGITKVWAVSTDGDNIQSEPVFIYSKYSRKSLDKTGWVATASSQYHTSYSAKNIVDNNASSFWMSAYQVNPPHWVLIDMKEPKTFDRITVNRMQSGYTKTVQFFGSNITTDGLAHDDASFTQIGEISYPGSGTPHNLSVEYFPEKTQTTRYIKMYFPDTHAGASGWVGISELYLYILE